MKNTDSYTPVSCDFVDQIEIAAMKGEKVTFSYFEENKVKVESDQIKTWFTREKVEYLETISGLQIRLDQVIEIDGFANKSGCLTI